MSTMIEFTAYDGTPIYLAKEKIIAAAEHHTSTNDRPVTSLLIALGERSEEWAVLEPLQSVRTKFEKTL